MPFFNRSGQSSTGPHRRGATSRVLFLDDDPLRAEVFLKENPRAVWVKTVVECLARLEERWHEVHLDHDLGGEQFVELDRQDCGMEVVRWLCLQRRKHLRRTRFYVHTHNPDARSTMAERLALGGYIVEVRPFGEPEPGEAPLLLAASQPIRPLLPPQPPSRLVRLSRRALAIFGLATPDPRAEAPAFMPSRADMEWVPPNPASVPAKPVERLDLSWASPTGPGPRPDPKSETRPPE